MKKFELVVCYNRLNKVKMLQYERLLPSFEPVKKKCNSYFLQIN